MSSKSPSVITVRELIELHSAGIAQLKEETKQYVGMDIGVPFDDLFILRFILSNKTDIKAASSKLKETLAWRTANLEKLNQAALGNIPHYDTMKKHMKDGKLGWLGNDLVVAVRTGLSDSASAMRELSEEQVTEFLVLANEINFRLVDARTREMGVLCKVITVLDSYGFSMSKYSRKFGHALTASSKLSNIYFPQLLRHTVFLNLPTALRMIFNAFRLVMPKETVEKQRVCPGKPHNDNQCATDCPFLKSRMRTAAEVDDLFPPFLGGHGPIPPELRHESDNA